MRQQRRTVGGLKRSHTKRQKQRPMHTLPQKTPNPMLPSRQNPAQSSAYRQHLLIRSSSHMKRCQSNTIYRRLTAIYHEKALHHHLRNTNARLLKPIQKSFLQNFRTHTYARYQIQARSPSHKWQDQSNTDFQSNSASRQPRLHKPQNNTNLHCYKNTNSPSPSLRSRGRSTSDHHSRCKLSHHEQRRSLQRNQSRRQTIGMTKEQKTTNNSNEYYAKLLIDQDLIPTTRSL